MCVSSSALTSRLNSFSPLPPHPQATARAMHLRKHPRGAGGGRNGDERPPDGVDCGWERKMGCAGGPMTHFHCVPHLSPATRGVFPHDPPPPLTCVLKGGCANLWRLASRRARGREGLLRTPRQCILRQPLCELQLARRIQGSRHQGLPAGTGSSRGGGVWRAWGRAAQSTGAAVVRHAPRISRFRPSPDPARRGDGVWWALGATLPKKTNSSPGAR